MKVLLIFDQTINTRELRDKLASLKPHSVFLFPLTSQWQRVHEIVNICHLITDLKIELMDSARLIDEEVNALRERVSKWSANFGNYKIDGKSLREWFLLPKGEVSSWWFSLVSEKNTLKTDTFFRLAQIQAFDKIISSHSFDLCIFSISEKDLSMATEMLCNRRSINKLHISSLFKAKNVFRLKMQSYLDRKNVFNSIARGLIWSISRILRSIRAKPVMGKIKSRIRAIDNSVLFISYFPAVDKESAKKGILRNRYAAPLQEKISQMGKKIIWIWMYVYLDGHSYRDALELAKKFSKNGEMNFFLDEFMSFKILFRALFLWLRQVGIFLKLQKFIPGTVLYEDLSIPEGSIFIKNLMIKSFIGRVGLEGILYFELYKEIFSYFPNVSHCIYYSEMHAWEKALCAAKRLKAPKAKTIAFIHASTPINFFPYFHHPSEMDYIPLPDVLACNGDISFNRLKHCGYRNIRKAEAIRHLYLSDYLDSSDLSKKDKIALIVGSIKEQETKALISLFYEAFPRPVGFQVWLKPHPSMPFEGILKELEIDARNCGYIIKHSPINELLKSVRILIVGSSAVAIEALAGGCRVINVILSDNMTMSDLRGFEEFYIRVYNPQELRENVEIIMGNGHEKENSADAKDFVSKYWCLDKTLKRWESLLR